MQTGKIIQLLDWVVKSFVCN